MGRDPRNKRPVGYSHQGDSLQRDGGSPQTLILYAFPPQYTFNFKAADDAIVQKVLYSGNSAKSLHIAANLSLKNLRTSYIDILYLHFWNWDTSIEEVMRSLHNLVVQGKVLYLVS